MTVQKFYLTFGVQYPEVPHPRWSGAHKGGWVLIEARDETQAREIAFAHFGPVWSMLYPADYFNEAENKERYYPLGQLSRLDSTGMHDWVYDPMRVVAVRIEGIQELDDEPSHETEYFHLPCAEAGKALFSDIDRIDREVWAFEIHASTGPCPVCGKAIL